MAIEFLAALVVGVLVGALAAYGFITSTRRSFVVVVQDRAGRATSVAGPYATAETASSAAQRARLRAFTVTRLAAEPAEEA